MFLQINLDALYAESDDWYGSQAVGDLIRDTIKVTIQNEIQSEVRKLVQGAVKIHRKELEAKILEALRKDQSWAKYVQVPL